MNSLINDGEPDFRKRSPCLANWLEFSQGMLARVHAQGNSVDTISWDTQKKKRNKLYRRLMFQMQNCLEQWRQQKDVMPPLTENLLQNRKESHCKADYCWPTRSYWGSVDGAASGAAISLISLKLPSKQLIGIAARVVEKVSVSILDYFSSTTPYYYQSICGIFLPLALPTWTETNENIV